MKILGLIPARYASTRFPGKPLVDIGGKTMIRRVYEQCLKASALSEVFVATDDQRILEHVEGFGGRVMMTAGHHRTGTERCHEALLQLEKQGHTYDVVINIQGDEPFIDPGQINTLAACFSADSVNIATLRKTISSFDELNSPNIIKVISNLAGNAIYFSRSPVPYVRGSEAEEWLGSHDFYKHIGIYAFRTEILKKVCTLQPTPLETAESLEQLRWLENGLDIRVEVTLTESHSIDTPEDLKKV
jgi:3-deoxy-manno-octulosonate cytidylyltransferase (CMP-KDO synthetase)